MQTDKSSVIVIMGAKVKEDGTPSGALVRRIIAAVYEEKRNPGNWFLVTGGIGISGYSEALTMRSMLQALGIQDHKIIPEEISKDTLASVVNCARIIREHQFGCVKVSSDIYHLPRCRWLFTLAGIPIKGIPVQSGRASNGTMKWSYYYFREAAAIIWDTLLILINPKHP